MFSQSFLCSRHRSGLLRLLHRSRGFVTHCRRRGALAMYAWGEGGRLFRSGTSNVPEPPDTAVADTMKREREALPDSGPDDDSVISVPDSEDHHPGDGAQSEASPGDSKASSLSETMFYPVSANATHAEAISGSSLPPLPRKGQTKEEREEWWKGQTEGRSRGSGGQGMSQLQEDQEGKDSNKNRSRGQQRLNRSPSRKRRSPSRKSRERPSPSPSRKSPSPSSKRRKVQAKQETAQPRESQSQEKQFGILLRVARKFRDSGMYSELSLIHI